MLESVPEFLVLFRNFEGQNKYWRCNRADSLWWNVRYSREIKVRKATSRNCRVGNIVLRVQVGESGVDQATRQYGHNFYSLTRSKLRDLVYEGENIGIWWQNWSKL